MATFCFYLQTRLLFTEVMSHLESSLPTLEKILQEVEAFVEQGGSHNSAPHIIDLLLPMLCSYLPFWWNQGPDNVNPTAGSHITAVTSDHMNQLLKNILNLIRLNIGKENCPWMIRIACKLLTQRNR